MKEENNEPQQSAPTFTEAEMNEMHGNARLNFYADAQEAKQTLDRRYARMVNHFGSYKKMPQPLKDMFSDDYAAHKAIWSENGTEMIKRFGVQEEAKPQADPAQDCTQLRQEFLQKAQDQRQQQQTNNRKLEYEL
jgi:hypothetical protein